MILKSKLNKMKGSCVRMNPYKLGIIIGTIIWIVSFLIGISVRDIDIIANARVGGEDYNLESIQKTTWYYFKTNFIVYNLIIVGFISICSVSFILLSLNAMIIGYFFQNGLIVSENFNKIILLTFTHCAEFMGFIVAFGISVFLLSKLKRGTLNLSVLENKSFIRMYFIGTALIIIGALTESNLTPIFLL